MAQTTQQSPLVNFTFYMYFEGVNLAGIRSCLESC